jgi:hypothetical protein
LIGWASRRAKAAVHTFAQNALCFLAISTVFVFGGEIGLHT